MSEASKMSNKEIAAIIGVCILFGSLVTLLIASPPHKAQDSTVPQGYLYLRTETFHALEVWQDNETRVNDTTTVLHVWYNISYNITSNRIEMSVWKSDPVNVTTDEVYHSFNTSQAIQWAIDNTDGVVQFHMGNYTLTNSVNASKSGLVLYGMNSYVTCEGIQSVFIFGSNFTNVAISGFRFDGGWIP